MCTIVITLPGCWAEVAATRDDMTDATICAAAMLGTSGVANLSEPPQFNSLGMGTIERGLHINDDSAFVFEQRSNKFPA